MWELGTEFRSSDLGLPALYQMNYPHSPIIYYYTHIAYEQIETLKKPTIIP